MRFYIAVLGKTVLDVSTEKKKPDAPAEPDKPSVGATHNFGFSGGIHRWGSAPRSGRPEMSGGDQ